MKLSISLFAAAAATAFVASVSAQESNLIEVAQGGGFENLLAALDSAALSDVIATGGPFTIFAPVDEAFGVFPDLFLQCLFGQTDIISDILLYHVVADTVLSTDLSDGLSLETMNRESIFFSIVEDGRLVINGGANITATDILASNGVVHSIDALLTPPEFDVQQFVASCGAIGLGFDVIDTLEASNAVPTLLAAINAAGLTAALRSPNGPYTLFAPIEEAFTTLPEGVLECLLLEENQEALQSILTYHVLPESFPGASLVDGLTVATIQGEEVTFSVSEDIIMINLSVVQAGNLFVTNGVIHVIDEVLLPPSLDFDAFVATCPNVPTAAPVDTPTNAPVDSPTPSPVVPSSAPRFVSVVARAMSLLLAAAAATALAM